MSIAIGDDEVTPVVEIRDVWLSDMERDTGFEAQICEKDVCLIIHVHGGDWPEQHFCYPAVRPMGRDRFEPYRHARPSTAPWKPAVDVTKSAEVPQPSALPRPTEVRPEHVHVPSLGPKLEPAPSSKAPRRRLHASIMNEDANTDGSDEPKNFFEYKILMEKASTATLPRRSGRQPVEQRADIGERPDGCSKDVWEELGAIHINLGHPANSSLTRMLLRHGVRPEVIDFVQYIKCSICIELSRKPSEPQTSSGKREATAFHDLISVDEFHVTLSDGHKVMLVLIIDVASRLAVSYVPARTSYDERLRRGAGRIAGACLAVLGWSHEEAPGRPCEGTPGRGR